MPLKYVQLVEAGVRRVRTERLRERVDVRLLVHEDLLEPPARKVGKTSVLEVGGIELVQPYLAVGRTHCARDRLSQPFYLADWRSRAVDIG